MAGDSCDQVSLSESALLPALVVVAFAVAVVLAAGDAAAAVDAAAVDEGSKTTAALAQLRVAANKR